MYLLSKQSIKQKTFLNKCFTRKSVVGAVWHNEKVVRTIQFLFTFIAKYQKKSVCSFSSYHVIVIIVPSPHHDLLFICISFLVVNLNVHGVLAKIMYVGQKDPYGLQN